MVKIGQFRYWPNVVSNLGLRGMRQRVDPQDTLRMLDTGEAGFILNQHKAEAGFLFVGREESDDVGEQWRRSRG